METGTSLMSDSEIFRYNLGRLHRLVFDGDFSGVRQVDNLQKIIVVVKLKKHNTVKL